MGPIPQASSRKVLAWLAAGPSSAVPARRRPKAAGNFSVGTFTMFASSTGESLVYIGSPWWKVGSYILQEERRQLGEGLSLILNIAVLRAALSQQATLRIPVKLPSGRW